MAKDNGPYLKAISDDDDHIVEVDLTCHMHCQNGGGYGDICVPGDSDFNACGHGVGGYCFDANIPCD